MSTELRTLWGDHLLDFFLDISKENGNFPKHVLRMISQHFGYNRMLFFLYAYADIDIEKRSRRDALSNFVALNLDSDVMNDYGSHVSELDIFAPKYLPNQLKKKTVLFTSDVMPRADYLQTEYYSYMSQKKMEKQACIYLYHQNESIGNICVFRSDKEPDFTAEDRMLMNYLSDLLSIQYVTWLRLTKDVLSQRGFELFFRSGKTGAVLLNSRLTVLMANPLAQELCADFVRHFQNGSGSVTRSSYQRSSRHQSIQQTIDWIGLDLMGSEQMSYPTLQEVFYFYTWPLIITNVFGDVETRHMILITRKTKQRNEAFEQHFEALTHREREVLALVLSGKGNHDIAQQLHISAYTVRTHISKIYQKFEVSGRTELLLNIGTTE